MLPSKYKEEYDQELINHLSSGLTFDSFAGHIGVGVRTIYDWVDRHESFKTAKEIGYAKSLLRDDKMSNMLASGQKGKNFNPKDANVAMAIFRMKTVHHKTFSEKLVHDIAAGGNARVTINYSVMKTEEKNDWYDTKEEDDVA